MKILNRFNGKLLLEIETIRADLQGVYLQGANLQGANLRGADLQKADLQKANLQEAGLRGADLQGANLWGADLQGAYLQKANLQGATLDYSCFPLWCGSFDMKVDDRLVWQLIAHLGRLDRSKISKKVGKAIKLLEPYFDEFCKYRDDVSPILDRKENTDESENP